MFPLTVTLAALLSSASLAITPVNGPSVPYTAAFAGMSPTIVIAGSQTISNYCKDRTRVLLTNKLALGHWWKSRSLEAGIMPKSSILTPHPRLIYTYENVASSNVPLPPLELYNLRIFTGARIVYAFTESHVAGAVCQTNMLDYRNLEKSYGGKSPFGPPLSCLEIKLKDNGKRQAGDEKSPMGRLVVAGPAVVGGQMVTDENMAMTDENTLIHPPGSGSI